MTVSPTFLFDESGNGQWIFLLFIKCLCGIVCEFRDSTNIFAKWRTGRRMLANFANLAKIDLFLRSSTLNF